MQVMSDHPLSDQEAVRLAVDVYFQGTQSELRSNGRVDQGLLMEVFGRYNDDVNFLGFAETFYWALSDRRPSRTS